MWLYRKTPYAAGLWFALIGNQTTVYALKGLFTRQRPDFGVYRELTASFPSGHSAASVAFYGYVASLLILQGFRPRPLIAAGGALAIGMIGASRLILGEHYLSDVMGGYLFGAVWVWLGLWLGDHLQRSATDTALTTPWRRQTTWAIVLCTGVAIWFTVVAYTFDLGPPATSWPQIGGHP